MVDVKNQSCYEYWLDCTDEYGEYYVMQHLGKKYYKSKMLSDIDALAAYMKIELGLKPGDVYTVFMPTTVQSICAFYALNKVGVIVNFVHPLLPPNVLRETMTEVNSKGVMVLDLLIKDYADVINEMNVPCLVCHSSEYASLLKGFGCKLAEAAVKKIFPKIKKRDEYSKAVKRFSKANVKPSCNCDDIAVYLNGGGTTGKSKTIKLTSRAINELVCSVSKLGRIHRPGLEAEPIVLPLFHCFGLSVAVHMAMCNAGRLIPIMRFDAKMFNRLMRQNTVVGFVGIPVMFKKIMNEKHFDTKHLKNLRVVYCGGDDAPQSLIDEFNSYLEKYDAEGRLYQGYGLTEVGSVCCTNSNENHKSDTIGVPLENVNMQIWNEEHNEVPNGVIGEIVISGPTIMSGYYTEDGEDDAGLYTDENGVKWVMSGDLGFRDDDGYFHFSGRKKRVIIISGYNVYPSDIEKRTQELDFVKDACCVKGYKDSKQIIRMFVSFSKNGNEEEYKKQILDMIEKSFSKFSVPREIITLSELPQTPLMKTDFMRLTQETPDSPVYDEEKEKEKIKTKDCEKNIQAAS